MKQFILITSFILNSIVGISQEFAFSLIFKDAVGNTDTILYGYDKTATRGIDTHFVEKNIIIDPINSNFDVRFSDVFLNGTRIPSHQSKKQIVTNECPNWMSSTFGTAIEIYSNNYPITVSWNKIFFKDTCRIGTILTDVHPGGWFDTKGTFRTFLEKEDNTIINFPYYSYVNSQSQTIGVMWIAFVDSSVFDIPFNPAFFESNLTSMDDMNSPSTQLNIYPNPNNGKFTIELDHQKAEVKIFNSLGKIVHQEFIEGKATINLPPTLNSGVYLIHYISNKSVSSQKLILNRD